MEKNITIIFRDYGRFTDITKKKNQSRVSYYFVLKILHNYSHQYKHQNGIQYNGISK